MTIRVPVEWPSELPAKLVFIGEAPSDEELERGRPFVGKAGRLHNKILKSAGISRWNCMHDNVFDFKLPSNDVSKYALTREQQKRALKEAGKEWLDQWPQNIQDIAKTYITRGSYLPLEDWHQIARLRDNIIQSGANVVVPLGNTALWALTGVHGISSVRGNPMQCLLVPGVKLLPTFHPSYLLKQYKQRVVVIQDLKRAMEETETDTERTHSREIWLEPDFQDLQNFGQRFIEPLAGTDQPLSVDIETSHGQIECIGFAPDNERAIVVPFLDFSREDRCYWTSPHREWLAWEWCQYWLEHPRIKLLGQNFVYDFQWLWENFGIRCLNYSEDTRLMHHAAYPELQKSLEFLASVYANEKSYKHLGKRSGKRDE